jgi:hypothetical protein
MALLRPGLRVYKIYHVAENRLSANVPVLRAENVLYRR